LTVDSAEGNNWAKIGGKSNVVDGGDFASGRFAPLKDSAGAAPTRPR
jgi:hypothetical protein